MLKSYTIDSFPENKDKIPDHQMVILIFDDPEGLRAIFKLDLDAKVTHVVLVDSDAFPINSNAFLYEVDRLMKYSDTDKKIKKAFETMSKKVTKEFHEEAAKFIHLMDGKL